MSVPAHKRSVVRLLLCLIFAETIQLTVANPSRADRVYGSMLDSLLVPGEFFVLGKEDLCERNINTLDDILRLLPGISWWREGPESAHGGFSIEGRSYRGANLFVNGIPVVQPYEFTALRRFLPISRLSRVEVIYSGSPMVTNNLSSQGAINLVIEEGGRKKPNSLLDFTYGSANRRARRAWFSTPEAHISGAMVYDEYLHDGIECIPSIPGRIVGKTDSRSILAEMVLSPDSGERAVVRFQRYEESYVGTFWSALEDVRYSGFSSLVSYSRSAFQASFVQNALRLDRDLRHIHAFSLYGNARFSRSLGPLEIRVFASGEKSSFTNLVQDISFNPSYSKHEGGMAIGGGAGAGVSWRAGAWGGWHDEMGLYSGGELAVAKAWGNIIQDLVFARRLRVPSAEELYEATALGFSDSEPVPDISSELSPELSEEVATGINIHNLRISIFGRRYSSRILAANVDSVTCYVSKDDIMAGVRAGLGLAGKIYGYDCSFGLNLEGYPEREALADGVPRLSFRTGAEIGRMLFKETERISVGVWCQYSGKRNWHDEELDDFFELDFKSSMTLLGAEIKFEMRNLLDEKYLTAPGFLMPGRYYTIGIIWQLLD